MRPHATRGDGNNKRCGTQAGDGRDAFAPNVGTRIFSVGTGTNLVDEGATGGILNSNGDQADTNFSYTVNIFAAPISATATATASNNTITVQKSSHGLSNGQQVRIVGSSNIPTGTYTITFANNMANANYAIVACNGRKVNASANNAFVITVNQYNHTKSVSAFRVESLGTNTYLNLADPQDASIAVFGD